MTWLGMQGKIVRNLLEFLEDNEMLRVTADEALAAYTENLENDDTGRAP